MNTSKQQISATAKAFKDELHKAQTYQSKDLTDEGLEKQRKMLADRVRAKYSREVDDHRSALYYDRDRSAFDSYRPKLDWNKPAEVAKAQAKWTAVQGKLDAGLSIGQIVSTADKSTLAAINEFYPDHAETMQAGAMARGQQYEAPDISNVHRAVDDRAAEIGGNTDRTALAKARQSAGLHAYADATLGHLEQTIAGNVHGASDLQAALDAQYAEQHAMSGGAGLIASHDANASADASQEAAAVSE